MKRRSPEQRQQQEQEEEVQPRLSFEEDRGWYEYPGIPHEIYYTFNDKTDELAEEEGELFTNEKKPAKFAVTRSSRSGEPSALSIWIHESVPAEFKDIVMFHELIEAKLTISHGLSDDEAHEQAVIAEKAYAEKHLSAEELEKYIEWRDKVDSY